MVHLAGGSRPASGTGPAFVLPSGDRPSHYLYETVYTFGGTTGSVVIYPNGLVYLRASPPAPSGVSTADEFTSLTSITFQVKGVTRLLLVAGGTIWAFAPGGPPTGRCPIEARCDLSSSLQECIRQMHTPASFP